MESRSREDFPLSNSEKMTNEEDLMNLSEDCPNHSNSNESRENSRFGNKNELKNKPLYEIADFDEAWKLYLASEKEWEEVYRRLADS